MIGFLFLANNSSLSLSSLCLRSTIAPLLGPLFSIILIFSTLVTVVTGVLIVTNFPHTYGLFV